MRSKNRVTHIMDLYRSAYSETLEPNRIKHEFIGDPNFFNISMIFRNTLWTYRGAQRFFAYFNLFHTKKFNFLEFSGLMLKISNFKR